MIHINNFTTRDMCNTRHPGAGAMIKKQNKKETTRGDDIVDLRQVVQINLQLY